MNETLRAYFQSLRWFEFWRLPKLAYLYSIDNQFNSRRAEFYVDLSKAIEDKESLHTWLRRAVNHWRKYGKPGLANYYEAMLSNLKVEGLHGMLEGLVPTSDLISLRAIDECDGSEEKVKGLKWLARTVNQQAELKKLVRSAVGIFMYVGPMIVCLLVMIGSEILPLVEQIMPYEKWPIDGKVLWWCCRLWTEYWFVTVPLLLGVFSFYMSQFVWWKGKTRAWFDQSSLLINLPHKFYSQYMSSVLLVALADLVRNKKILSNALTIVGENSSPFLRWHIESIVHNLKNVQESTAMAFETGLLSPATLLRLRNYAERKDFDAGLVDISERGFEHIKEEVKKSSEVLNFLSLLSVGVVIVLVYIVSISLIMEANDFVDAMKHVAS